MTNPNTEPNDEALDDAALEDVVGGIGQESANPSEFSGLVGEAV